MIDWDDIVEIKKLVEKHNKMIRILKKKIRKLKKEK